ncbi:MAG TPA: diaminopimelate decarboxylase [Candidatus Acidoferrales bacterium]|nr:diaminopimelate decarboxylase [Candidatus Acidoferrales bacterium]
MARLLDPAKFTPQFAWRGNRVFCENVPLDKIAAKFGTPSYVYSRAAIENAYRNLDRALSSAFRSTPRTICYAVKANPNLSILKLLARLGSGFDIVSGGELDRLRRIGVRGDRIVFSGVGKTREEIREALRARIRLFNVESAAELELLAEEASRARFAAPASLRVNPDVAAGAHPHIATGTRQHKFGVDWPQALKLYRAHRDSKWISWQGISAHIGSQIVTLRPYASEVRKLAQYVKDLRTAGINLRYVDAGGGLGVRYTSEEPPDFAAFGRALAKELRPLNCHVLIEPGRALVALAGVLLMSVLYTKQTRGKTFVIVDAAMNDFMRPALYSAVHPITRATRGDRAAATRESHLTTVAIAGPVCETGDVFLNSWPLPEVAAGDSLILWGAGAYGFTQSSNYNSRLRPAEILVEGARARVIRRRESRTDMLRAE